MIIEDNSSISVFGRYSEDAGITWTDLPEFTIEELDDNTYCVKSRIVPRFHGKLRVQIKAVDEAGNVKTLGYFNTTYSYQMTSYGDELLVAYHTPQIRILFPLYYIIPVIGVLIAVLWVLIKKSPVREKARQNTLEEDNANNNNENNNNNNNNKNKNNNDDNNDIILDNGEKNSENRFQPIFEVIDRFKYKLGANRLYLLSGLIVLFLFSFILQAHSYTTIPI